MPCDTALSLAEYSRYSRQLLLPPPAFHGIDAQLRLKRARVLVVGAGGLGCPSITFLAAAGIGHITVIDPDIVEVSNLARQFLHTDEGAQQAISKVHSVAHAVARINPHVHVRPLFESFSAANALDLVADADLVLDCTDNPLTRYLISDAAVLAGKPVVSGAAQGIDGQIVVLNKALDDKPNTTNRGPCYRCLFPRAPRPEEVQNCSDGGVLGVITGLIGTLQALEAIKLLAKLGEDPYAPPTLLLASPLSVQTPPFRTIKLRPRRTATCRSCGDPTLLPIESQITALEAEDYLSFCGLNRPNQPSQQSTPQIDVSSFARINSTQPNEENQDSQGDRQNSTGPNTVVASIPPQTPIDSNQSIPSTTTNDTPSEPTLIIDVRPPHEYHIAHLSGSHNVPLAKIRKRWTQLKREREKQTQTQTRVSTQTTDGTDDLRAPSPLQDLGIRTERHPGQIHVLCRRGNDSREAVSMLSALYEASRPPSLSSHSDAPVEQHQQSPLPNVPRLFNVTGGLHAYAKHVDPNFPVY
ncbi:unnamed protein product [Tilletia controversa]|uniref:Rhodanese domain-containing protein n=3 Tax=Tilletia TaxID=13289 RepID=A0A8X7MZB8_9BASI|nr:hypothetical protein CF336_g1318 [Tilletia laevis]KAE8204203.1 hypothetical protein CF328_g1219 [Tilletia controversa]KAE8264436.1 hypothetical protein A4X03_0g946 [Tilletia caries]KAE8207976.1 hypothetical protein CF335_g753 [Tilletia laevis]KAE8253120.1 hypothetical protein A4X06_0g1689 [Tilletia controversa]